MTSGEAVTLLVTLQAGAGSGNRLRDELATLAALSRADPGCVRYDVLEDLQVRDRFVLWEEWLDEASLVDHNTKPHVARFLEVAAALSAVPMEVQRLRRSA
ncbi:putative quinol monooxygenase [Amnibacterium sp.]|uniref:putative quinol monooxygenase n=1 Tax=Amnibacterium sp. TaxID=1872496 RepID=UPI002625B14F|nr:putative quinol monooxygenase [Amnibacterium sp.]MCU1473826.1 Antibiotic biosynthesis monooxygenase [Amnibacterium sp.]